MACDKDNRRLFPVCCKPGMLVVLDTNSGEGAASLPAAARAGDVAFDKTKSRLYVPGGEERISLSQQIVLGRRSLPTSLRGATEDVGGFC